KILTGWNSLMISALSIGARVLHDPQLEQGARRAAELLLAKTYDPRTGVLSRRYRDGQTAIPGFLTDYAYFSQALLDLYETTFEARYLRLAISLSDRERALFEDKTTGGFRTTAGNDPHLLIQPKETYDGAEPSGNSIAAMTLLRLAAI